MELYLTNTLQNLATKNYSDITIVLGNESCDLDSAVSALVYASFLHWQHNIIKCRVCTKEQRGEYKDSIFVPILDVAREDFELKTEVAFCFKEHGISAEHLVFRDDLILGELVESVKTNIVLVDHHIMSQRYQSLVPYVTEIIDHRPMDSKWPYQDVRSTIEIVGSCCTLIAKRIRDLSALMDKGTDFFKENTDCSEMLHDVILLDTVNFSKQVNKATPVDIEMVEHLEELLNIPNCQDERQTKVDRLVNARRNVSQLSASQLLRKDLKVVGDILVPSFPILVEEFLQKPSALNAVHKLLASKNCMICLLLGMNLSGGLSRDAAIVGEDSGAVEQLAKFLQDWSSPSLQLSPQSGPICYFKQLNLSASRKQYMPALNAFCDK